MNYVYLYEDPKTGVPRYVGKGKNTRCNAHLKQSHNNRLHNMIQKRLREGFDVKPSFIVSGLTPYAACALEIFWIAVLGRDKKKAGPLFNATDGGDGAAGVVGKTQAAWNKGVSTGPNLKLRGKKLSAEAIAKRTETRRLRGNGRYSPNLSDEARQNIKTSWDKRRELYGPSGRKSS